MGMIKLKTLLLEGQNDKKCDNCKYLVSDWKTGGNCALLKPSQVSPNGMCDLWEKEGGNIGYHNRIPRKEAHYTNDYRKHSLNTGD